MGADIILDKWDKELNAAAYERLDELEAREGAAAPGSEERQVARAFWQWTYKRIDRRAQYRDPYNASGLAPYLSLDYSRYTAAARARAAGREPTEGEPQGEIAPEGAAAMLADLKALEGYIRGPQALERATHYWVSYSLFGLADNPTAAGRVAGLPDLLGLLVKEIAQEGEPRPSIDPAIFDRDGLEPVDALELWAGQYDHLVALLEEAIARGEPLLASL